MDLQILEMLYNMPEIHTLSYQLYQEMPGRISGEACLEEVWRECDAFPDPAIRKLFHRLEDAENYVGALQNRASFFTGMYLGWGLSQAMTAISGYSIPFPHRSG